MRNTINNAAATPGSDCDDATGGVGGLCECQLASQNASFAGTAGISANNQSAGFRPAYLNTATGEMVMSCFADGSPSPIHVLDGLPDAWVAQRDTSGHVRQAVAGVVAGFMRCGRFYTREAAAHALDEDTGSV